MKICKKCLFEKDDSFFRNNRCICKECHKIYYRKNYEEKNREIINNNKKNKYLEKKDIIKNTNIKSYLKHREIRILNMKKYCNNNKEKIKEYQRQYNKTENRKISRKTKNHERRIIKKSGEKINKNLLKILIEKQNYECNNCKCFLDFKIKRFVHLDHIIPLSKGGEHKIENLQYLCQKCNLQKGNKLIK